MIGEDEQPLDEATINRLARINEDFTASHSRLGRIGPAVSVFGSARVKPDHAWYDLGQRLGYGIAEAGFAVITGGGPGLMEAVNSGAHEAGGRSVGLGIQLPFEDGLNPYVHTGVVSRYFFVRKMLFLSRCSGLVALPGGLGTLDELFEILTMMQTGKTAMRPVALAGVDYWAGLMDWLSTQVLAAGLMSAKDIDEILVSDDVDVLVKHVTTPIEALRN